MIKHVFKKFRIPDTRNRGSKHILQTNSLKLSLLLIYEICRTIITGMLQGMFSLTDHDYASFCSLHCIVIRISDSSKF